MRVFRMQVGVPRPVQWYNVCWGEEQHNVSTLTSCRPRNFIARLADSWMTRRKAEMICMMESMTYGNIFIASGSDHW